MLSEADGARHLDRLEKLQMLLSETGLATHLLEQSKEIPLPLLIAGFHQDQKGRDRFLHFSFLPMAEQDIQAVELLQMYCTLPFRLTEGLREQAALLLLEVNSRLPLGHFGINKEDEIHYRYVYGLPAAKPFDEDEILDIISMSMYMCDLYAEEIEDLASGASRN